jgi:MFS family permease
MKTINQAISVLTNPKQALKNIKNEKMEMMDIIMYLAIVGIPILIGFTLGYGVIAYSSAFIGAAIAGAIAYYILAIIGIILFGFLLNTFAPTFKSKQNKMLATKLVAYSATPWLLAGIFLIFPAVSLLTLVAGLYGLYILYLGIPIYMETPKDQQIPYLIVSIVIFIIIMGVVGVIATQIWSNLFSGSFNPYYTRPFF